MAHAHIERLNQRLAKADRKNDLLEALVLYQAEPTPASEMALRKAQAAYDEITNDVSGAITKALLNPSRGNAGAGFGSLKPDGDVRKAAKASSINDGTLAGREVPRVNAPGLYARVSREPVIKAADRAEHDLSARIRARRKEQS